jgi:uncharacterized membrane protein
MIPLFVLVIGSIIFRVLGWLGVAFFANWHTSLRVGLACMFFVTASAHWGRRRPDLMLMVPARFGPAGLIVTATGTLEIAGAIGLLIPATVQLAAMGLAMLLIAMFPANIQAVRRNIDIAGTKPLPLAIRAPLQIVFILATLVAGGFIW